ncbi:tigger transposable element-derived protein 6 [Ixodes scapularis]
MGSQNRKALLFIDNCPAHPKELSFLRNVRVEYLPPNATSHLQPLDAGIIKNVKHFYRKWIVRRSLAMVERGDAPTKLSILDVMHFLAAAWDTVSATTVQHCFRKCSQDTRLQEAGAEVVCCLARGALKGPNLPRAQLNHQDALFPGHGLATHSQTWVGLSHFYSGSVVSPKWLGSVVTLLTKHQAPKVQAPPAELGVRGDATLRTPAFTGAPCGDLMNSLGVVWLSATNALQGEDCFVVHTLPPAALTYSDYNK